VAAHDLNVGCQGGGWLGGGCDGSGVSLDLLRRIDKHANGRVGVRGRQPCEPLQLLSAQDFVGEQNVLALRRAHHHLGFGHGLSAQAGDLVAGA
jgi:hypothetical protein